MTTTLLDVLEAGSAGGTSLAPMADAVIAQVDVGVAAPTASDVSSALATLLDEPIGNLAHRAWRADRAIAAARERTRKGPEPREVLRTLEHTVRWSQSPQIDIFVAGQVVYTLQLEVAVAIEATAVHIVVERGEVVDVSPGAATAEVVLSIGDRVVARRRLVGVDLTPAPMEPPQPRGSRTR